MTSMTPLALETQHYSVPPIDIHDNQGIRTNAVYDVYSSTDETSAARHYVFVEENVHA